MTAEPLIGSPQKRKAAPLSAYSSNAAQPSSSPNQCRHRLNTESPERESNGPKSSKKGLWDVWWRKWEVPRKVLHSSIGFITLHRYMANGNPSLIAIYLSKALVVIWLADVARFRSRRFASLYETLLGFLMRPSEKHGWNGVIFYLLGVIISLSTLPLDISVLSILILSWVDTAASVLGRLYGSRTPSLPSPPFAARKSLAGFLSAFATGTLTSSLFWSLWARSGAIGPQGYSWVGVLGGPGGRSSVGDYLLGHHLPTLVGQLPNPRSSLGLAALSVSCGLVGSIAEAVDVCGWDDNLVVPVLSGWGIWGLMKLFG
ncbi:hypothetical protein CROQUDRAFT_42353 [Cronartium quercuum f. sp. fusiforme G11]|uniref:Phosphatidate cytidylyltransferase n=1 Tax=Cronartium quercuum f. sp. fusiforme G11 TaxID=708437 RepID=A0A9P6TDH3_9BASI|nr:hypothetical protein CROQUDRAFT_42353 [Cronartium quercuum f. sp. fusiforme G11]